MKQKVTKVHPKDNVMVALTDLNAGEEVTYNNQIYNVIEFIPAKHKFALTDLPAGTDVIMYGVLVGRTQNLISTGGLLTTGNIKHAASGFQTGNNHLDW